MFILENGKYVTRSRAIVLDNRDPKKRGRIRVKHPLLGETVWVNYLKSPGFFDVPSIGDVVYLECDAGYDAYPVAHGNIVKGKDENLDLPEQFQRVTPTNRGIYTPGGHLLEFDDGVGSAHTDKGVRLTTSGGIKIHVLEGNPSESKVLIETPGGAKAEIDGQADSIKASVAYGDSLELSAAEGFQIKTPAGGGTSLSMKSGEVKVTSANSNITLSQEGKIELGASGGAKATLDQGKVAIGSNVAETLDLVEKSLKSLVDNASSLVLTAVGPGQLNPAVVTILQTNLQLLAQIKGTL